jgi:cell wall-associated NlpC family hydrolase
MKKALTIIMVLLVACSMPQHSQQEAQAASVQRMRFHCDQDTTRINQLLQEGIASGIKTPNELVAFYADRLLGTPYVAHTLEGDEELLTINIDELDCTTFVETLYALARTTMNGRYSWLDYAANLENVRYRNGEMGDYSSRLHYISEWILNNASRGNLKEVTPDLPHANYLIKTIDFMTNHKDSYRSLKDNSAMVEKIKGYEMALRNHRMPYLKKSWLGDKAVKAALRDGDFVGLVTKIEGLDISHLGIIHKDDKGEIYLLDASMSGGKVMLESKNLRDHLSGSKSTCLGVRVFRIVP